MGNSQIAIKLSYLRFNWSVLNYIVSVDFLYILHVEHNCLPKIKTYINTQLNQVAHLTSFARNIIEFYRNKQKRVCKRF